MHQTYRGVNDAFRDLVTLFSRKGLREDGAGPGGYSTQVCNIIRRESRNGPVLMIDSPVLITYEKPLERVLFNHARDANPFALLYESLWMLAGRNDVDSLAYYTGKFREYSDDGKTLNGSYGNRWRSRFGIDQISKLTDHLIRTPGSRRAVLQMWGVSEDLTVVDTSKDVCCLAGETVFRSPEGDVSIREVTNRFQSNSEYRLPIYTVDPTTGLQGFGWMTNAWKVGLKKVIRLRFDDGSIIRLTTDHVLYRKSSLGRPAPGRKSAGFQIDECEAGDLSVGDTVLAELSAGAKSRTSRDGRRQFKRSLADDTKKSNLASEHREYWKFAVTPNLPEDYDIHHKNEDKTDNRLENLEEVLHSDHQRRHKLSDPSWGKYVPNRGTDGRFGSVNNHKIISVETVGYVEVYDFTIPGRHNAVLTNGVVVHNCNLNVMFSIREIENSKGYVDALCKADPPIYHSTYQKYLDITVTNRSNDLCWGLLGANFVTFSVLQEYMAARLGVEVGRYHHVSNNLHAYDWNFKPDVWLEWEKQNQMGGTYLAYGPDTKTMPLVHDQAAFEKEIGPFVERHKDGSKRQAAFWTEPFLKDVAEPMFQAYHDHKEKIPHGAMSCAERIKADDWRIACINWLKQRAKA